MQSRPAKSLFTCALALLTPTAVLAQLINGDDVNLTDPTPEVAFSDTDGTVGPNWSIRGYDELFHIVDTATGGVYLNINPALSSLALGASASSNAESSTALGVSASSGGNFSAALGYAAISNGHSSTALGRSASSAGTDSIALGYSANSSGPTSIALGNLATSGGDSSVALGRSASSVGPNSIALGRSATSDGDTSMALGYFATSGGYRSTAVGYGATTTSTAAYSTALGYIASSGSSFSTALGYGASSGGLFSIALGSNSTSGGGSSIALGSSANSDGANSAALGFAATSTADRSTALGNRAFADQPDTIILGSITGVNNATAYANVGIGTHAPVEAVDVQRSAAAARFQLTSFTDTASEAPQFIQRRARGTTALPTAVQNNDNLGLFSFRGYNGTSMGGSRATITAQATGTFTDTSTPTRLIFSTTPVGSTAPQSVLVITPDGKVQVKGVNLDVPDYVFEDDYALMPLDELRAFIDENGHLPGIPSADEVNGGVHDLAGSDMTYLRKIEELTLYTLQQQERITELEALEERVAQLEAQLNRALTSLD